MMSQADDIPIANYCEAEKEDECLLVGGFGLRLLLILVVLAEADPHLEVLIIIASSLLSRISEPILLIPVRTITRMIARLILILGPRTKIHIPAPALGIIPIIPSTLCVGIPTPITEPTTTISLPPFQITRRIRLREQGRGCPIRNVDILKTIRSRPLERRTPNVIAVNPELDCAYRLAI